MDQKSDIYDIKLVPEHKWKQMLSGGPLTKSEVNNINTWSKAEFFEMVKETPEDGSKKVTIPGSRVPS